MCNASGFVVAFTLAASVSHTISQMNLIVELEVTRGSSACIHSEAFTPRCTTKHLIPIVC